MSITGQENRASPDYVDYLIMRARFALRADGDSQVSIQNAML